MVSEQHLLSLMRTGAVWWRDVKAQAHRYTHTLVWPQQVLFLSMVFQHSIAGLGWGEICACQSALGAVTGAMRTTQETLSYDISVPLSCITETTAAGDC